MLLCTDVSGKPIVPISEVEEVEELLDFEDGPTGLSRNVGTELPLHPA
jgi:hypothetical protein